MPQISILQTAGERKNIESRHSVLAFRPNSRYSTAELNFTLRLTILESHPPTPVSITQALPLRHSRQTRHFQYYLNVIFRRIKTESILS